MRGAVFAALLQKTVPLMAVRVQAIVMLD